MYLTQQDLHVFFQQVHQICAKKLGIEDYDWKSASELADEIREKSTTIADKLGKFIEAYQAWFNVNVEVFGSGEPVYLSAEQSAKLQEASAARDSTRKEVIDELDKLPRWSERS